MSWAAMKPETVERRRLTRIAEQSQEHADTRARLLEAVKREAARFPGGGVFAEMLAEFDARPCEYERCTLHER